MPPFLWAVGASLAVSLISLVGAATLLINEKFLNRMLILFIGFSAGALIGGAFFHLLTEAVELAKGMATYGWLIVGFVLFFVLERYLLWHHCHEGECEVHPFGYLNLVGDGIHNFIDGLAIGASFALNVRFGIVTTVIVILHEIPQEIGDFGVLIYGGFSKPKALFYNFISGIFAVLGSIIGFHFSNLMGRFLPVILAFTAGGFIYIASCDLIPEIHRQSDLKKSTLSMAFFILGVLFMFAVNLARH